MSEAESRRKEKSHELETKKLQAERLETNEPEPENEANEFSIDYKAAARDALKRVQQKMATREIEQKVTERNENERAQDQLNSLEATAVQETTAPSSSSMKLNVICGQTFGLVSQGSKIQSINSLAGHQVIRNLSETSEFTMIQLDNYTGYLRQAEPRT